MSKISSKTHTKQQLDNYANQHNPNNKAYWADHNNRKNQNTCQQSHTRRHNKTRKGQTWVPWAPDYIEYND